MGETYSGTQVSRTERGVQAKVREEQRFSKASNSSSVLEIELCFVASVVFYTAQRAVTCQYRITEQERKGDLQLSKSLRVGLCQAPKIWCLLLIHHRIPSRLQQPSYPSLLTEPAHCTLLYQNGKGYSITGQITNTILLGKGS